MIFSSAKMGKATTVIVFCAALSVAVSADLELPRTVKRCQSGTDDYHSCLRLAIQDAIPRLVVGLPEFDLPVLDPYLTVRQEGSYANGVIRGKVTTKNTTTYGLARVRVLSVRSQREEGRFHLEVDLDFPKIFIEGEYEAEGMINDFKIGGDGVYNISMEGVTTTWELDGPVENDKWIVEHFIMLPHVTKMKVWFSDLFNGIDSLNKATLSFVNEFWPLFYREMLPIVAVEWDKEMTKVVNGIFSKISFSKTFP